jgi:hypothetical protein
MTPSVSHPPQTWLVGVSREWVLPGAALCPAPPDLPSDTLCRDPDLDLCHHAPSFGVPGPGMASSWCAEVLIVCATWVGGRFDLVVCGRSLQSGCAPVPTRCYTSTADTRTLRVCETLSTVISGPIVTGCNPCIAQLATRFCLAV